MDNVSHSVAGMLAAETLLAARGSERLRSLAGYGRVAWVTSALANNLPDADLLYTALERSPLAYVLHHRGHTHTLALGLPLGLLSLAVPWLWARRTGRSPGREGWALLVLLALLGPALHLALDSSNNYGVHPFWPVWDGWLYGDTIFIVEPLFWVGGLALLLPSMRSRLAQGVWGVLLAGMAVTCWVLPFVSRGSALFVTLLGVALLAVGWRRSAHARMAWAVGLSLAALAAFGLGSVRARTSLEASAATAFPGWRVQDAVLTPLPANPLCWEAIAVMVQGEQYALRRAQLAPWPPLGEATGCPRFAFSRPTTLPYAALATPPTGAVVWRDEHVQKLAQLRGVFRDRCVARAFSHFARIPFAMDPGPSVPGEPEGPWVGDARYDSEEGRGFAELALGPADTRCPEHVPPWTPPREDLLR
ncbi:MULTISPECIES: metal-dependent hydrolase [Myxococcaceae]|uniref:metal-dependent hydrolase n=1 Tax=Myxococcaceae TaxID=31 RepID=UPI00188F76AB|nr:MULTISPECIES: metal-dependent hydrolase [Myxococcaceae]MBF5042411.1 metal-dependent hydrolase [Simulacricoccus sp. 17bor-14]